MTNIVDVFIVSIYSPIVVVHFSKIGGNGECDVNIIKHLSSLEKFTMGLYNSKF